MFQDRKDAAIQLAAALEKHKGPNTLVLGIPRGGAETAYYVAKHLGAAFSLLVSRKLGHPGNPEYAVGAIAEDGSIFLNETAQAGLSQEQLGSIVAQQQKEIERRIQILRKGKKLPDLKGKTVLLVDDGIATGSTVFAAIRMCRKKGVRHLVVAAPVSGMEIKQKLLQEADEVVILETPDFYRGVSQVYESFRNLTDEEALAFVEKWQEKQPSDGAG